MPRVVVLAHGGLGNQLFQLAAARSLAVDPLVLGYAGAWGAGHPTLVDLGIPVAYPHRMHRTRYPGIALRETWRDDVSSALARAWGAMTRTRVVGQRHPFDAPTVPEGRALVLNGYFQHPGWWGDSWRALASELAERGPQALSSYQADAPAVVKLRRSDYLSLGWALPERWLRDALSRSGLRDRPVIVAAEDDEARSFAAPVLADFGCTPESVPAFTGNPNIDDFWAIAGASTIIAANSSYAWWAAAIATVLRDGQATVIYPDPWLPNAWSDSPLPDLGLPGWIAEPTDFGTARA